MAAFKHPFAKPCLLGACVLALSGCGLTDNVTVLLENRTQTKLGMIVLKVPGDQKMISALGPNEIASVSLSASDEGGLSLGVGAPRREEQSIFYVGRFEAYHCTVSIFEDDIEQKCRIG